MTWWIAATVCAYFVKGLCGFANTLIFTTMLSFGHSNVSISPVELLLGYPTNLILVWRDRKSIRWSICGPLALLVILGCIPGALFLKNADSGVIKMIFGVVIILLSLEMLLRELRPGKARPSRLALGIIGILSGLLCGLYGIGALISAYVSRVTDDSRAFKANICVVFAVEETFRIILYSLWGILTLDVLRQAVLLVPFMLGGLFLGIFSVKFLDERVIRKLVIVMLLLSGLALIVNNLI